MARQSAALTQVCGGAPGRTLSPGAVTGGAPGRTLSPGAVAGSDTRRELQRVVNDDWTGRASPGSAAYRLVREFRLQVGELAFAPIFSEVRKVDPTISVVAGDPDGVGEGACGAGGEGMMRSSIGTPSWTTASSIRIPSPRKPPFRVRIPVPKPSVAIL